MSRDSFSRSEHRDSFDAAFDNVFDNIMGLTVGESSVHDSDSVATVSPRLADEPAAVYDCDPEPFATPRVEEVDDEIIFHPAVRAEPEAPEVELEEIQEMGLALSLGDEPDRLQTVTRAEKVGAVNQCAEELATEDGGGALGVLRIVARLLRGDSTIARCKGGDFNSKGASLKKSEERFDARIAARRAAAKIVEAVFRQPQSGASPRAAAAASKPAASDAADAAASAAVPRRNDARGHKILRKSLLSGMFAVQAKHAGAELSERRFQKHLGIDNTTESSKKEGFENGSFVLLWSFREWVPCRVERSRLASRGRGKPKVPEVQLHELGRDDLVDKWIPIASPRIRTVVNTCFPSKRRGDFAKHGTRVRSSWSLMDERHFWAARGAAKGPVGTVVRIAPERDAAEVDLDGLVATESVWLPLHALRQVSDADDDGHEVLAARDEAADLVQAALAQHEGVKFRKAVVRMLRGQRAVVTMSYEDESRGRGPEKIAWTVEVGAGNATGGLLRRASPP